MTAPNPDLIEARFKEAIDGWVQHGRLPTGSFTLAVLQNDLERAFTRGDDKALANLPHIVAYLRERCPAQAWGSSVTLALWPVVLEMQAQRRAGGAL